MTISIAIIIIIIIIITMLIILIVILIVIVIIIIIIVIVIIIIINVIGRVHRNGRHLPQRHPDRRPLRPEVPDSISFSRRAIGWISACPRARKSKGEPILAIFYPPLK